MPVTTDIPQPAYIELCITHDVLGIITIVVFWQRVFAGGGAMDGTEEYTMRMYHSATLPIPPTSLVEYTILAGPIDRHTGVLLQIGCFDKKKD